MNSFSKKYYHPKTQLSEKTTFELPELYDLKNFLEWWSSVKELWLTRYPERIITYDEDEIKIRREFINKVGLR